MPTTKFLSASLLLLLLLAPTGCSGTEAREPGEKQPTTNPWNGGTYLLDITVANWSEPRGIGHEIDDFVPNFLMHVEGEDPAEFTVTMGTADADGVQDPCNLTSTLDATTERPNVTVGPAAFPLHIKHVVDPVAVDAVGYGMTIKNVFPNGSTPARDGEFSATMDFREVYELFTLIPEPTPDKVCQQFYDAYTIPCEPCPRDEAAYCLTLKAVDLGATKVETEIQPIAAGDVDPVACTPTPE